MVREHGSLTKDAETNEAAWEAARGAARGAVKVCPSFPYICVPFAFGNRVLDTLECFCCGSFVKLHLVAFCLCLGVLCRPRWISDLLGCAARMRWSCSALLMLFICVFAAPLFFSW
jgi:hypothetical protein